VITAEYLFSPVTPGSGGTASYVPTPEIDVEKEEEEEEEEEGAAGSPGRGEGEESGDGEKAARRARRRDAKFIRSIIRRSAGGRRVSMGYRLTI
jgi:hypothetical protein